MPHHSKIVVYTAIFGQYDTLKNPLYEIGDADLVCFTDDPDLRSKFYDIRLVEPAHVDPKRASQIYKTCPHRFLPEYTYSLWIDGSALLKFPRIQELIDLYVVEHAIALFRHPDRDCIYDELAACIELKKDDPDGMMAQIERYRAEGFPAHNGLISGGFILRKQHDPEVVHIGEEWLKEIGQGSKRDQLSFNYVAWKNKLAYGTIPGWSWDNEYCTVFQHQGNLKESDPRKLYQEQLNILQNKDNAQTTQLQTITSELQEAEKELTGLREKTERQTESIRDWEHAKYNQSAALHEMQKELQQSRETLQAVRHSWSWRLTAPVRKIGELMHKLRRKINGG